MLGTSRRQPFRELDSIKTNILVVMVVVVRLHAGALLCSDLGDARAGCKDGFAGVAVAILELHPVKASRCQDHIGDR